MIAILKRYAAAHRALWTIYISDWEKTGLFEETAEWSAANSEACDAVGALRWWHTPATRVIDWHQMRGLDFHHRMGYLDRTGYGCADGAQ